MTYGQYCGFNEPLADKKPTAVDAEAVREKQYNYSGAVIIGNVVPDTEAVRQKQYNYSKAFVSHGETIEDVPEDMPEDIKKSACAKIKDFFMKQQKFGRHPFATNM